MSTPSGGSGSSPPSKERDFEEAYRRRMLLFAVLVAAVAGVGLWMAYTSLDEEDGTLQLTASTSGVEPRTGDVTLVARMLPADSEELGRKLVESRAVNELAGGHRPFLARTGAGRRALCVGLFESRDADELKVLQSRFREFTLDGQKVFPRARPRRIGQ